MSYITFPLSLAKPIQKTNPNRTRLAHLKRKLSQSTDQKRAQLDKRRNSTSAETIDERQKRLAKLRQNYTQRKAKETDEDRHKRLEKLKKYNAKQRAVETDEDRHKRLQKLRDNDAERRAEESIDEKQERLKKGEMLTAQPINLYKFKILSNTILTS